MVNDVGDAPCWADRVCDACGALVEGGPHICPQATRKPLPRKIVGFHRDGAGEWVAELSCRHNQHIRHRPPFQERPWVTQAEGRAGRMGAEIDCPLCARAQLPEGLSVTRTAGPFDAAGVPAALLKDHVVADGTWGRLQVIEGRVTLSLHTDPPTVIRLSAGDRQAIPPGLAHVLTLDGPVRLAIDFLIPDARPSGPAGTR